MKQCRPVNKLRFFRCDEFLLVASRASLFLKRIVVAFSFNLGDEHLEISFLSDHLIIYVDCCNGNLQLTNFLIYLFIKRNYNYLTTVNRIKSLAMQMQSRNKHK